MWYLWPRPRNIEYPSSASSYLQISSQFTQFAVVSNHLGSAKTLKDLLRGVDGLRCYAAEDVDEDIGVQPPLPVVQQAPPGLTTSSSIRKQNAGKGHSTRRVDPGREGERITPTHANDEQLFKPASNITIRLELVDQDGVRLTASSTTLDESSANSITALSADQRPPSYKLVVESTSQIAISSTASEGLFYGIQTLRQLLKGVLHFPTTCAVGSTIHDEPGHFKWRCAQLDVSRGKIPTMEFLLDFVERISLLKYNALQLYQEGHAFAYRDSTIWLGENPITGEEIFQLDAFCASRNVTLMPVQNCLGHLHRILKKPQFRKLAERPDGIAHPFSLEREPFSITPCSQESIDFCVSLVNEQSRWYSSNTVNIWCDEPFDVGTGQSYDLCRRLGGKRKLCLEHVKRLCARLIQSKKRAMVDAKLIQTSQDVDYLLQFPLTKNDLVLIEWEYEAGSDWSTRLGLLDKTPFAFWIAPGTSSWNSCCGRQFNAIDNIFESCSAALQTKCEGLLVTDWGDNGHFQPPSASWVGILSGSQGGWMSSSSGSTSWASDLKNDPNLLERLLAFHFTGSGTGRSCKVNWALGSACGSLAAAMDVACPSNSFRIPNMELGMVPLLYPLPLAEEPLTEFAFKHFIFGVYPKLGFRGLIGPILSCYLYMKLKKKLRIDAALQVIERQIIPGLSADVDDADDPFLHRRSLLLASKLAMYSLRALRQRTAGMFRFHRGTKSSKDVQFDPRLVDEFRQVFTACFRDGKGLDDACGRLLRLMNC